MPIASPWVDAARAILDGELARAADIISGMGNAAGAAHASLRAAAQLAARGDVAAAAYRRVADSFYEVTSAGTARSRRSHPWRDPVNGRPLWNNVRAPGSGGRSLTSSRAVPERSLEPT